MNQFLVCVVWYVAAMAGGGEVDRPLLSDSTDVPVSPGQRANRVEARFGDEGGVFEVRHSWLPFLSTDLFISTNSKRGWGVGLSIDPFQILSIQGNIGFPLSTDGVVDGPAFDPEYAYGLRGAFLIPLTRLQSGLYVSLSAGRTWIVDKNFGGGGFLPPDSEGLEPPETLRKEVRTLEFFEIGVGLRF